MSVKDGFTDYEKHVGGWFVLEAGSRRRFRVAKFIPRSFFYGYPGYQVEGYRENGTKIPGYFVVPVDQFLCDYREVESVFWKLRKDSCIKTSSTSSTR